MNTGRLYPGFLLSAFVVILFSCATPKPVLYNAEGGALSITEYEKLALDEYENGRFENSPGPITKSGTVTGGLRSMRTPGCISGRS
jgi:hypothetical protein